MFLPGFPLTFLITIVNHLTSGALAQLIGVCDLTALQACARHFSGSYIGNVFAFFAHLFLDFHHEFVHTSKSI